MGTGVVGEHCIGDGQVPVLGLLQVPGNGVGQDSVQHFTLAIRLLMIGHCCLMLEAKDFGKLGERFGHKLPALVGDHLGRYRIFAHN
jgi:hypothetical protein